MNLRSLKIFSYHIRKFIYFFFKHFTLKKFFNLLLITFERLVKRIKPKGKPFVLNVEPTNRCNLRCPACPTGSGKSQRKKGNMTLDTYKRIIDELADYIFFVILHIWGEPFLNPDIFKMIKYAQKKNIGTVISSNLNPLNKERIKKIVSSGLEHLIISLDAATQETYQQYRQGGNFDKVTNNLKILVGEKKRQKSQTPFIEWQFIKMKHNQHELKKAKKIAKKIGVNKFKSYTEAKTNLTFFKGSYQKEKIKKWLTKEKINYWQKNNFKKEFLYAKTCLYLWNYAVILYNGDIMPCCYIDDQSPGFGNINENSFVKIWRNQLFQASRNIFKKNKKNINQKTVCHLCKQFKKP